jgi:phosphoglycolate phosphatase
MMINEKHRLIAFDLDGTLIDSADLVLAIINHQRLGLQKHQLKKYELYPWLSLGGLDLISNALDVPIEKCNDYLKLFRDQYKVIDTPKNSLFPGVVEVLKFLKKNNFLMALITNKPRDLVNKIFSETELGNFFDFSLAGDDLSTKKPNPQNIYHCCDYFNIKTREIVLIGDSSIDQKTAMNSSIDFIFFSGGYDDGVDFESIDYSFNSYEIFLNNLKQLKVKNELL